MTKTRIAASAFLLLYIASFVLAVAPTASAQGEGKLTVKLHAGYPKVTPEGQAILDDAGGKLPPESSPLRVQFFFDVIVPSTAACLQSITVAFTAPTPNPAQYAATLSNPTDTIQYKGAQEGVPVTGAQGTTIENFQTTLSITFSRNAPTTQDFIFEVKAQAKGFTTQGDRCSVAVSDEIKVPFTMKPDYIARLQLTPKSYTQNAGQNKQVSFGITLTNLGNGPTKVKAEIIEKNKGLYAITAPVDQSLDSKAVSATATNFVDVLVTARTPTNNGYTNKVYAFDAIFTAKFDGSATGKNPSTDSKTVTLSVKVQGVYVPGFDASMVIAALGIALLGAGMVRRRAE